MTLDVRTLLTVEPRSIGAAPSEPLTFMVTVANDTRRFVRYRATITGLDDTDVTSTPAQLDLEPGAQGVVQIDATLPAYFPAGRHVAGVELRSNDPGNPLVGFVEVEVDVQSVASARLQMPESHLRGRFGGRGTLTMYNGGTQPVSFRFSGHNPEHKLRFKFKPDVVTVQPGTAELVRLRVGARPRPIGGSVRRAFDVVAQGPSGQLSVSGTVTHKSLIPNGFFKLVLAGIVMVMVALLIQLAVRTFIVDNPTITWQRVTTGDTEVAARTDHSAVWVEFPRTRVDQPFWRRSVTAVADWFSGRGRFDEGMVVWGGTGAEGQMLSTGALYRSRDGQWLLLPTFGAPAPRTDHGAEWTGETMVVWGGRIAGDDGTDPGAEYNPATQRWSTLPSGPLGTRRGHTMTWTGDQMIIFGGMSPNGVVRADGARIFPGASSHDAEDPDVRPNEPEGELSNGTWATMSKFPGPARHHHTATWTGAHLVIVGGFDADGRPLADAYAYDPISNTWDDISRNPPPQPRACHTAAWTGTSLLLVGGIDAVWDVPEDAASADPCARTEPTTIDPESFLITPTPEDIGTGVQTNWAWERPENPPPEHLGTDSVGVWTANELTIVQRVPNLDTLAAARYTPDQGIVNLPLPNTGIIPTETGFTGVWNTGSIVVWGGIDGNRRPVDTGAILRLPDR